jgi:NADH:ubiquinone oxidoreductase subunit F (NADH-binding)
VLYDVHHAEHPVGSERFDVNAFLAKYGPANPLETPEARDALLNQIDQHRVHGRGGAHFPSAIKIRSALAAGGGGSVIANAAEGEPSAAKDAALWQSNPHLVLRGLFAVAKLTSAHNVGVWVHEDSFATRNSIDRALKERHENGIEPHKKVRTYLSPHRYVSGEASAIINAVQGGPAIPKFFPTKARAWGEGNPPVLVFNTETLAHIGLLAGAAPQADSIETTLVTMLELERRTVSEVSSQLSFANLLGEQRQTEALLLGGYGGQWATWQQIQSLPVHEESLREHGLSLGAGIIAPLPAQLCGVVETARITAWMAGESAQQCGPCIFGLQWLTEDTAQLARGGKGTKAALRRMRARLPQLVKRGACAHPDGVVRMVNTALDVFADEIALHRKNRCSASSNAEFFPTRQGMHA